MFDDINLPEKEKLVDVINYLLGTNFLISTTEREKYFIARKYEDHLQKFFRSFGWEFRCDTQNEVAFVSSLDAVHRRSLKLEESTWLLVLRLLYEEKRGELSWAECPVATLAEIRTKYEAFNLRLFDGRNKTKLKDLVSLTRRYNLIDQLDEDINSEDCKFRLFHSLIYAVPADGVELIRNKIQKYVAGYAGKEAANEMDETSEAD